MTDLLVRNIPDDLKQKLAVRAAENGRSQSAEALSILQETLQPEQKRGIFEILREAAEECGGFELELPERHPAREFSFEEV
jgi:plasmid stability protein